MFTGEHERLLDEKGRLVLPPPLRRILGNSCFVRAAQGPCVQIYPEAQIVEAQERLDQQVRAGQVSIRTQRVWSSGITEVNIDAQGRVPIPAKLRETIGVDREVILIGVTKRAELWNPASWQDLLEMGADEDVDESMWI